MLSTLVNLLLNNDKKSKFILFQDKIKCIETIYKYIIKTHICYNNFFEINELKVNLFYLKVTMKTLLTYKLVSL